MEVGPGGRRLNAGYTYVFSLRRFELYLSDMCTYQYAYYTSINSF